MNCLVCESQLAPDVAIIGDQYPSAIYLDNITEKEFGLKKSSLNLSQCLNSLCNLVQLSKPIDLEVVYKHYPYQSGTTATMRSILSSVVEETLVYQSLEPGEIVLDIGGNDGTLLNLVGHPESFMINIDAASNISQDYLIPNYTYVNGYFTATSYFELSRPSPKIIFCVAVFYQLNKPLKFLQDVCEIMNNDSLFVLQMTYLESMYSENIFDNIVHEHVTYFSLKSLKFIAKLAGLKVIGARVVTSYGGSLRVFLVKETSSKVIPNLVKETREILEVELKKRTEQPDTLAKFGDDFEIWRNNLKQLLESQIKQFGPIIGMGASTKGNMILQSLEIKEDKMPYIMDNNPKKIGSRTTGSFIPIVGEETILELSGNVMSLPYYYDEFFKEILSKKIRSGRLVDFISPLPNPSITRILGK